MQRSELLKWKQLIDRRESSFRGIDWKRGSWNFQVALASPWLPSFCRHIFLGGGNCTLEENAPTSKLAAPYAAVADAKTLSQNQSLRGWSKRFARRFLVACTQLYKPVCWLVRWSLIAWSTQLMAIGLVTGYNRNNEYLPNGFCGSCRTYLFASKHGNPVPTTVVT